MKVDFFKSCGGSRISKKPPRSTHLDEGDADADAGKHAGLVFHLVAELGDATDRVDPAHDFVERRVDEDVAAAALRVVPAAAIWHVSALAERRVGPVRVVFHAAALDLFETMAHLNTALIEGSWNVPLVSHWPMLSTHTWTNETC